MIRVHRCSLAPLAIALVALLAAPAHAQLNISWDDCGGAGTGWRNFACNTNSSPLTGINANILVGSFVSPGLTAVSGEDAFVTVQSGVQYLPPWWLITNYLGTVAGCRPNSVLETTFGDGTGLGTCADFFGTRGCTGGTDYIAAPYSNQATIRVLAWVPAGLEGAIPAGQETYSFTIHIRNDLTVGAGSCPGCADGVTLTFDHLLLLQTGGAGDRTLQGAAPGGRNFADINGFIDPATPRTWGQVKALYR